MAWWSGTVTATNGSANVTIVSGDPIDNLVSGNALIIGSSFNPVEIKRAYFNGTNNIIELVYAWPNATQTSQPAKSFTTDADLIPIGKTLALYLNSFTKASQTDAVTGTDNTNVMTALRTKEAIQALVKSAAYLEATTSKLDHTLGRVFKMGDLGMGRTLDLRTSTGGAYADYDTPQKCYNKGTLFGFIDGASLGIPNYSASAYGVLTIHGHYTDASGAMGTCQEFRYGADVWIRAYASATTWNSWTKLLKTGDNGFGTHLQGIKNVMAVQNPSEVLTTVNSSSSDGHYQGMIQNHGSYAPEGYGKLSGFVSLNNNYSYTWQEFIGYSSTKWRRNATSSTTWTEWRKVLEKNDFGIGGTGGAYTRCDNANTLTGTGHYWTAAAWVGSPYEGTNGTNQGYLIHQDWGSDNMYAIQHFYNVNGGQTSFYHYVRRKDYGEWGAWTSEGDLTYSRGPSRLAPRINSMVGINANNLTEIGWYINAVDADSSSNMPTVPVGGTRYWFIEVMKYDGGGVVIQKAHNYTFMSNIANSSATPFYVFQRMFNGTVWSSWQPIVTPQIGQVYFDSTSGYNVGAVIERGSNANGEYVKFADGTLICKLQINETTAGITTPEGSIYRNASGLTWAFPAAFVDYPALSGQFPATGAWLSQRTNGTTSCIYYWQAAASISVSGYAQLLAVGRWR